MPWQQNCPYPNPKCLTSPWCLAGTSEPVPYCEMFHSTLMQQGGAWVWLFLNSICHDLLTHMGALNLLELWMGGGTKEGRGTGGEHKLWLVCKLNKIIDKNKTTTEGFPQKEQNSKIFLTVIDPSAALLSKSTYQDLALGKQEAPGKDLLV